LNVLLICPFWISLSDLTAGDGGTILLAKLDAFDGNLEEVAALDEETLVFCGGLLFCAC